jgi:uncharacterized protein YndB with AHSA1/START domain
MEKLSAKASIQILKSVDAVFEAIVNPALMANYFIAEGSGWLEEGATVTWKFPEFEDRFPVLVKRIVKNELISFDWSGGVSGQVVVIKLSSYKGNCTVVEIEEFEMAKDDAGINAMIRQTEGWANFLACLKAYLEYGVNLRKGAFDFMFDRI